ncbi:MAG: hypothetical protein US76_02695 [Parcubacteria group bacterium GW2011_GWA2_38_13b]|nr:MAG: hypothetical protein US76_02695 [Parcubacteria group bacterium GW2011_GWA2_38_13b]
MNYIVKIINNIVELKNNRRNFGVFGFTMVELLVVVAIIGLVVSLVLASFSIVQQKSRDARRVVDVDTLVKALHLYNNSFSVYPIYDGYITGIDTVSADLKNSNILKSVPLDPINQQVGGIIYKYNYFSSNGVSFQIQYCLETDSIINTKQGCENYARP